MLTLAPRLSSTLSPGGAMPAAEVEIPPCVISQNNICASKIFVHVLKIFAAGGDEDCAGCGGAAREEAGLGETM